MSYLPRKIKVSLLGSEALKTISDCSGRDINTIVLVMINAYLMGKTGIARHKARTEISIRLDSDRVKTLRDAAFKNHISLTFFIGYIIDGFLAQYTMDSLISAFKNRDDLVAKIKGAMRGQDIISQ